MQYKLSFVEQHTALPFHMETYSYPVSNKGDFHSHEFFEIGIVLEGSGKHYVDQSVFSLKPGTVYFIPIGMSHAISVDAHTRIENLYILPKIILDMLNLSGGSHLLFMDFFLTCILKNRSLPLHLQLKEEELQIFRKHSELFSQAPQLLAPLFQIYQSNLFVNLLFLLCDNWIRPALSSREPSLSRELRILQLIYKNIQLPVSQIIQWIADDLELNPQYLNRIVKNSFHTPLSQLILETKLEKSCQFLEENSTITETALTLGFYDHSHYTRYFTRYFGISPSSYQKKHLKV